MKSLNSISIINEYLQVIVKGLISHAIALLSSRSYWIVLAEGGLIDLIYVLEFCVVDSILFGIPLWLGLHLIFKNFRIRGFEKIFTGYMLVNVYYMFESYMDGSLNHFDSIAFFAHSLPVFSITFYIIWLMITWLSMPIEEGDRCLFHVKF